MKKFISFFCYFLLLFTTYPATSLAAENVNASIVDYDIIYVRYDIDVDADPESPTYVTMPQGEHPYEIEDGADLVLLKPDGSEIILVDCETCSVMDPTVSFDAKSVYYSLITEEGEESSSWLYKIKLEAPYTPIRLTFNDGFDSKLYAANTTDEHDQSTWREIRDMAPIPLSDGRILFTSNRSSFTALSASTDAVVDGSVQQLYVMDDHDGEMTTSKLSQMQIFEMGTIHLAQHPIQLKDGRILFSSWQDVATRIRYSMTSLFTVNPDGTDLKQFTEPHDSHSNLEHFITQLPDEKVVSTSYYPSFDFGFGILLRYPLDPDGPDFLREHSEDGEWRDFREFSRKDTQNITPHTIGKDQPAPEIDGVAQGKYSMPSVTKDGDILVAFSEGYVNHFAAVCASSNKCEDLKSGIYIIQNPSEERITNKDQLIKIKDDPLYNEIWPKPVLTYQQLFGQETPNIIASTLNNQDITSLSNSHIQTGQAVGLVGTSSMYNRESSPTTIENDPDGDVFQSNSNRIFTNGNWTIQGTDAGVYNNSDIYGVRIISTPAKPYTKPINGFTATDRPRYDVIKPYLNDTRLPIVVARYASFHNERWEILGEFPLTNKETIDLQGNPDTSWVAKIPADTPFLIQTIDEKGMTLNTELTWRGLKSGEVRTDCGGCHAHSIEALEFSSTEAYKNLHSTQNNTQSIMSEVNGVNLLDPRVKNGVWDLSTAQTPLLSGSITAPEISFVDGGIIGVEFNRDVTPILEEQCVSCHQTGEVGAILNLESTSDNDVYLTLRNTGKPSGGSYITPQKSHYIRTAQARQSLLTWVVWGERLDGRTNDSSAVDIDYTAELHEAHASLTLSAEDKRTIARWIDLGSPIDFPQTDGMGYTEDNQLPIISINVSDDQQTVNVGLIDAHSGIDWSSVLVSVYPVAASDAVPLCLLPKYSDRINGVNTYNLSVDSSVDQLIEVEVLDEWGNKNIATKKIKAK